MAEETLDQKYQRLSAWGTANLEKYTHRFNFNAVLKLYGNWRRANDGQVSTPRPTGFPGKERLKWDHWKAMDDKSVEECKRDYIEIIEKMNKELLLSDPTLTFGL